VEKWKKIILPNGKKTNISLSATLQRKNKIPNRSNLLGLRKDRK
jgi:hypothetical protein